MTDINPAKQFYFERPPYIEGISEAANVAFAMGAVASRLVAEERTRCNHPDGRAENVAEHSFMLAKVAPELAILLYPELDPGLVARFAIVHDDVEAYVGDTATDRITADGLRDKEELERQGLEQLKIEYANIPSYAQLVSDYEAQEIPEARFVRVVDKLMVLLIHFPNDGAVLQANWTQETMLQHAQGRAESLLKQYPEFEKLVDLRNELVQVAAHKFFAE